ncbi:MAG: hypothetical protein IJV22_04525 [Bacteroidales bacterium]|nr:hypothetical protein [Bacteroidales bacterium]
MLQHKPTPRRTGHEPTPHGISPLSPERGALRTLKKQSGSVGLAALLQPNCRLETEGVKHLVSFGFTPYTGD